MTSIPQDDTPPDQTKPTLKPTMQKTLLSNPERAVALVFRPWRSYALARATNSAPLPVVRHVVCLKGYAISPRMGRRMDEKIAAKADARWGTRAMTFAATLALAPYSAIAWRVRLPATPCVAQLAQWPIRKQAWGDAKRTRRTLYNDVRKIGHRTSELQAEGAVASPRNQKW